MYGCLTIPCTQRRVVPKASDCLRQRRRIAWRNNQPCLVVDVHKIGAGSERGADARQPARQRFDQHNAERFRAQVRWEHKDIRLPVERGQVLIRHITEKAHPITQPGIGNLSLQSRALRSVPGDPEFRPFDLSQRLYQEMQPLVVPQSPDEEQARYGVGAPVVGSEPGDIDTNRNTSHFAA